ncbi:MAG: helix-turn-helix transcriptional regulator [Thermoguttaceae bacterium]|jgi:hypothetical protein
MKKIILFSDELRAAIANAPISRYRLWQLTGIDQASLARFVAGKEGLSLVAIDKIAQTLGLHIVVDKPKSKKGGKHGEHRTRSGRI